MRDLPDVLPERAPPPGGELRLRHALRPTRRSHPAWGVVAASALAAALGLAAVLGARPDPRERELQRALQAVLAPQPPVVVQNGSLRRLPSSDTRVQLYLVAIPSPDDSPR